MLNFLKLYTKSQYWNCQKLDEFRNKKLMMMVNYAYNNIPYYRQIFRINNLKPDNIKNTEDVTKIPILTRKDIVKFNEDLIAPNRPRNSLVKIQTSGTTGHPLTVYKDRNEISSALACLYRAREWWGYNIGEKRAVLWSANRTLSGYDNLKEKLTRFLIRCTFFNTFNLSEENIEETIAKLNRIKPKFLSGYTSPMYRVAQIINEKRIKLKFSLTGVSTTAEPLFKHQRTEIENAFQCQVFDQYGCGECNSLGFECQKHTGLHIPIERVHVELLDEKTNNPVSEGEMGKIVITCLENYGMPIIRYDTEDLAIKNDDFCSCGRNLPLMHSIVGRTQDFLRLPNGSVIYGAVFMVAINNSNWINKYHIQQIQVFQKKNYQIILQIKSLNEPNQKEIQSFKSALREDLKDTDFEIKFVDQIPPFLVGQEKIHNI